MKAIPKLATAAVAVAMLVGLIAGCQKEEGPAEKAGKEVDQAMKKVGEKIEKVGDVAAF
jgi:cytochrome c556